MILKLKGLLSRHRYKIAVFVLLSAASALSVLLEGARIAYSDSTRYITLVWNLFLAWIPFALAFLAYALSWKRTLLYLSLPIFAFLWLIFFPNAPYILTDLQHLSRVSADVPLWYDVILLIWFAWTGLLLGMVSLYLMQDIIRREFGRIAGWIFVFGVAGLSGVGIYMGRFFRWNSWDILQDPAGILSGVWQAIRDPSLRSIGFTGLFAVFFLFVYLTLYAFGHLLQEQGAERPTP